MIIRDDDYVSLNLISALIEDFVAPVHRERLRFLLSKPNRRREVERSFASDSLLDQRFLVGIEPEDNSPEAIYRIMKKWGARSKCFAFGSRSLHSSHVGQGFGSEIALYCRESKVGYWRGHDGNDQHWLMHRTA